MGTAEAKSRVSSASSQPQADRSRPDKRGKAWPRKNIVVSVQVGGGEPVTILNESVDARILTDWRKMQKYGEMASREMMNIICPKPFG